MIFNLDCRHGLAMLPENSVDAIVCDPPYGLNFMGKKWDYDVPSIEIWEACLKALKPGGYLLAFAGTRTQHRMACRIEDAGFEIRDMIAWVYGSGFPKHQSSLKPALEPITLARKPAKVATLLNIDTCRVESNELANKVYNNSGKNLSWGGTFGKGTVRGNNIGRYPANLIHDGSDEVRQAFPDAKGQQGDLKETGCPHPSSGRFGRMPPALDHPARIESDKSAARFFYCAKAGKRDRNEGLEAFDAVMTNFAAGTGLSKNGDGSPRNMNADAKNPHPTVKPTELMRYLCRLVTPPGGLIVDPFAGSGSTGKAAILEGFQFVGFELDPQYTAIANARVEAARDSLVRVELA
jgi:DNA modification methylase